MAKENSKNGIEGNTWSNVSKQTFNCNWPLRPCPFAVYRQGHYNDTCCYTTQLYMREQQSKGVEYLTIAFT